MTLTQLHHTNVKTSPVAARLARRDLPARLFRARVELAHARCLSLSRSISIRAAADLVDGKGSAVRRGDVG